MELLVFLLLSFVVIAAHAIAFVCVHCRSMSIIACGNEMATFAYEYFHTILNSSRGMFCLQIFK